MKITAPSYLQETILEIKRNTTNTDSINYYSAQAIEYAKNLDIENANNYIEKYIRASGNINFVDQHEFEILHDSIEYQRIVSVFKPMLNGWSLFFFFSSVIGIFISLILQSQKNKDKIPNVLIALFVFFHSILIADLGLFSSNFRFQMSNSLFVSTTFSFLYGPLLYFYFKKTTTNYKFKVLDMLHLIPSVILLIYILPYYLLSPDEKLHLMLNMNKYLIPGGRFIFVSKAVSLSIYALLVFRIYKKQSSLLEQRQDLKKWQNRISTIFSAYAISYVIYGLSVLRIIELPFLVYLQGVILSSLVLYVAYRAFTRPALFLSISDEPNIETKNLKEIQNRILQNNSQQDKYLKSGLTANYSLELKESLLYLLNDRKLFKTNNLTLEKLSIELETNRHNTSQVINEHFNMNFFELINKYRIEEAKLILEGDFGSNRNIIDVAYEVGFNNKVTFNKSFKKETGLTPSQYRTQYKGTIKVNSAQVLNDLTKKKANLFSGSGIA